MTSMRGATRALLVVTATAALSGTALADGWNDGGMKDAAPASGRKLEFSANVGGTSDYIFRGISQTQEDPAFQAGFDLTYGIFYTGIWGSNVDFGPNIDGNAEVDIYAGLKPVWGPVTFDFGVIYYAYPGADNPGADLDYVELKAGYSLESPWIKGLTSGTTVFWSPDYSGEVGDVFTIEAVAAYALPKMWIFDPSVSGTWGTVYGDRDDGFAVGSNLKDEYDYWNAGLVLGVENFTFDFRYWDTNIRDDGLADERFVFTAKVSLP